MIKSNAETLVEASKNQGLTKSQGLKNQDFYVSFNEKMHKSSNAEVPQLMEKIEKYVHPTEPNIPLQDIEYNDTIQEMEHISQAIESSGPLLADEDLELSDVDA